MKNFLFIALAVLLVGCKTVSIYERDPIRVPTGLKESDVEDAILLTLGKHSITESNLSGGQKIADNALKAGLGRRYVSAESGSYDKYWYFEEKTPGTIFVAFRKGDLYMRVALNFDAHQIKTSIVESRNFRQSETKIHKQAYVYLQDFEGRLHRSLGDVAREINYAH